MGNAKQVSKELSAFVEKLVVKLSSETTRELTKKTPRDTGFAESNWIPQIGSFNAAPVGTKISVGLAVDAQKKSLSLLSRYKLPKKVFIVNNVSYIVDLNEGTSTQAPSGFVQNAIAKAIKSVI